MHSLLNPSLWRGDQGNLANDSAIHYPSVRPEKLMRDKTFGERNLSDSPEVIHIC